MPFLFGSPEEIAAHVARGDTSGRYISVLPGGRSNPPRPLFMYGEVPAWMGQVIYSEFATAPVGCYTFSDTLVTTDGVVVSNGKPLWSDVIVPRHRVDEISQRLGIVEQRVRIVEGAVAVISGPADHVWGHWLIDFLPRLWVIAQAGFDLGTLKFLVAHDAGRFAIDLLKLIGIEEEQCVVYNNWRELVKVDRLIVPTGLRLGNRLHSCFGQATEFWVTRVKSLINNLRVTAARKIFVSRLGARPERELVNRVRVEHIAATFGYEIVCPENHSILEQVLMFHGARAVAGEYGSALHNIVFSRPGTVCCAIRGTSRHPGFFQSGLSNALDQAFGYVLCPSGETDIQQTITVDEDSLNRALHSMEVYLGHGGASETLDIT